MHHFSKPEVLAIEAYGGVDVIDDVADLHSGHDGAPFEPVLSFSAIVRDNQSPVRTLRSDCRMDPRAAPASRQRPWACRRESGPRCDATNRWWHPDPRP